jgi:YfiH family protein
LERFAHLAAVPCLVHGVTTRAGGESRGAYASLNIGRGCGDDLTRVERNRGRVAAALGTGPLETPRQIHGDRIAVLSGRAALPEEGCDGLLTATPGRLVGVLGADCPGVLLVAPERRTLAVVHAGWRGIAAGVVLRALELLQEHAAAAPGELLVGVGPGISAARYEVSTDVAERIRAALPRQASAEVVRAGRPGHAYVDLQAAIRAQLLGAGVPQASIETHAACTFEDARFFSHRRDEGVTGRHALVAGWIS